MSNRLGSLFVSIGLNAGKFTQGMTKAEYEAFRTTENIKKQFGTVAKYVAGLGIGAALVSSIRSTADYADEIAKLSARAGETAEEMSKLSYAARQADVDNATLAKALRELSADALAGGEELAKLGIKVTDASGKVKTGSELFKDLSDVISGTIDPQTKAALAAQVLGNKLGPELVPLLNAGRGGLESLGDEAERFGRVVTDDAAKAAEEFNDNITKLQEQASGFAASLGNTVIPWLNKLIQEFRVGIEVAGGFASALALFGTTPVFDKPSEGAKKYRDELQNLIKERQRLVDVEGVTANTSGFDRQIEAAKKRLDYFNRLDLAQKKFEGADQTSAEARRLGILAPQIAPEIKGGKPAKVVAPKAGKAEDPEAVAKRYLSSLQSQLQATERLTVEEALLSDIQAGRLGKVSESRQKELQEIARQIDTARELQQIEKDFESAKLDTARATVRAREEQDALLKSMLDATPTRQLEKQRAEMLLLADAFKAGKISAEEFGEAASTRLGNVAENQKKANEQASMFGQIMDSTFENAIIKGEKFSTVLKGLTQDLLKLFLRKQVTEPLAQAASGAFGGLFGGVFGNSSGSTPGIAGFSSFEGGGWTGNGARSGGLDGKGGYLAMVHPKERIIDTTQGGSGGATIIQHVTIDARGADAGVDQKIMQAMRQTKQETLAAVQAQANRGGSFASAVGRR